VAALGLCHVRGKHPADRVAAVADDSADRPALTLIASVLMFLRIMASATLLIVTIHTGYFGAALEFVLTWQLRNDDGDSVSIAVGGGPVVGRAIVVGTCVLAKDRQRNDSQGNHQDRQSRV
jgi:hypothetical protein